MECRCGGVKDDFRITEQSGKFMLGIWQRNQLLLKSHAFEQDYPGDHLGPIGERLQGAGVTVIMRATEQDAATMIVLREKLERFCVSQLALRCGQR
jgi:hypothetical protein